MIKHIVIWKLKDSANDNIKMQNAQTIKSKLEALSGKIPGLIKMEVGINISKTENSADLVLYSEFKTKVDLDNYQVHPEHKAAVVFLAEVRKDRWMVDYEV